MERVVSELEQPKSAVNDVMVLMPVGGMATRASQVTKDRMPKHLIELDQDTTVLDVVLGGLQKAEFRNFVFCVGNHKDQIKEHVVKENWIQRSGVSYDFSEENDLLGGDGAVLQAIERLNLNGEGIIVPGDIFLNWTSLTDMSNRHIKRHADITFGVTSNITQRTTDIGRMAVEDETDRLIWCYGRSEEPQSDIRGARMLTSAAATMINIGSYVEMCGAFVESHPQNTKLSFRDDVAPWASRIAEFDVQAYDLACEALDLGTPDNIRFGQSNWRNYV